MLPYVKIGRNARLKQGGDRPRRQHPGRAGGRRGSGARRQALPPHRERHLPDHPADDRQARTEHDRGSRRRLRGLPAGQDRRARRRRRRPAGGAGAAWRRHAHAGARLSGGDGGAGAARDAVTRYDDLFGGAGAAARGQGRRASISSCSMRRISTTGRQSLSRPRRQGLAGQLAALRRAVAGRGGHRRAASCRGFVPDIVHCPRLAGGAGAGLSALSARRRTRDGRHHPQPRLPGPVSRRRSSRELAPAAAGLRASTASNITAASASSRPGCMPPTPSPRSARPMPQEICTPEFGMGLDGLLRARRDALSRHRQRHRHRRLEPGDRPAPRRDLSRRRRSQAAQPTSARVEERFGLDATTGRSSAWSAGSPGRRAWTSWPTRSTTRRARARGSRCSAPATRRSKARFHAAAARHPGRIGVVIGYDEALSHLHAGRRRRHPRSRRASSPAA